MKLMHAFDPTGCVILETSRIPLHLRNPASSLAPTVGARTQSR
jgi:hypothetical protein